MAAVQASPSLERPQYHHFIPRFILRNFAHTSQLPQSKRRSKPHSNRGKRKGKNRTTNSSRYEDQVLHIVDLANDTPELVESPVGTVFGLSDMYRDFSKAFDQHYLEKNLSKLESDASTIIAKIREAFESGGQDVSISRPERNTLRKFLFIMKYRGKRFHQRFVGDQTEGYVAEDKDIFLKYMHDKGFQTPLDVWFSSIKTILELKMDAEGEWMGDLPNCMYPLDAFWFILHAQMMYLSICTPDSVDAEFILTENSYNIFEGPITDLTDPVTGKAKPSLWTSYHEFAPISPKLMIVLRSFLLPNPEEDMKQEIREWRETIHRMTQSMHEGHFKANSLLADLPIRKARNSYLSMGAHGWELVEGEDGSHQAHHRFCFEFFKISTKHVNLINTIMLENAYRCQAIAYRSQSAFQTTIEHYLTLSPGPGTFKLIDDDDPNNPRMVYLLKLERLLKQLGSDKRLVYQHKMYQPVGVDLESLEDDFTEQWPDQPSDFMQLYMRLGGNETTLSRDIDQSTSMVRLRVKIDVWSNGLEESEREHIRENLGEIYCQLPNRQLWLYLKGFRDMAVAQVPERLEEVRQAYPDLMDGPENIIVRASDVIRPDKLGRLMYFASLHYDYLLGRPHLDISAPLSLDDAGIMHFKEITALAFGRSGTICECGIEIIEELARLVKGELEKTQYHLKWHIPVWTYEENIEMLTRLVLRDDEMMDDLLGDQLPRDTLHELKEVLFNFVYLTYNVQGGKVQMEEEEKKKKKEQPASYCTIL